MPISLPSPTSPAALQRHPHHAWLADGHGLPLLMVAVGWLLMASLADPRGEFPLNDDWVYALAVKSLLETGVYQFPSPASANVGPQVFWGALFCLPYGFSFTALRVSTLVLGLVGAFAFYFLVRIVQGGRASATLCALMLAANPLYFSLSNSFMTDVPFVTTSLIAMGLLLTSLNRASRASRAYAVAGLLVALAAILIRQLGIVVIIGYVVATVAKHGWSTGRAARGIALITLGLAVHFGYQYWLLDSGRAPQATVHSSLQTLQPTAAHWLNKARTIAAALLYSGFLVAPFVAQFWLSPRSGGADKGSRLFTILGAAAVITVFAALLYIDRLLPVSGNTLLRSGVGPLLLLDLETLKVNQPVIPPIASFLWATVSLLAVAAIVTVLGLLARPVSALAIHLISGRAAPANWQLAFFATIAVSYFSILVLISGRVHIFDRYHLLFLPLVTLMICCARPARLGHITRRGRTVAATLVFLMAAFSVASVHDFLAWNRARWTALNDLMAQGVSPKSIDGGYEFNGWYLWHLHAPTYGSTIPGKSWWWVVDDEYVIAAGDLPNYVEVQRYTTTHWLFGRPAYVLALRRSGAVGR